MDATCSLLIFRNEVKLRYAPQPHVYHQLVQLLQRFSMKTIDINQLKSSMEHLLADSPDLIQKFFVQLTLLQHSNTRKSKMFSESSRDFVLKVKEVFDRKGRPERYKTFVSILRSVATSSLNDTFTQVELLFFDEPQLLEEFENMIIVEFLSSENAVPPPKAASAAALTARSPAQSPSGSPPEMSSPKLASINISAQRRKGLGEIPKMLSSSTGQLLRETCTPIAETKARSHSVFTPSPYADVEKGKSKDKKTKKNIDELAEMKKDSKDGEATKKKKKDKESSAETKKKKEKKEQKDEPDTKKKDSKFSRLLLRSFTKSRTDVTPICAKQDSLCEATSPGDDPTLTSPKKAQSAFSPSSSPWKSSASPVSPRRLGETILSGSGLLKLSPRTPNRTCPQNAG